MGSVQASTTKTFESNKKVQAYNKAGSVSQTFTIPANLEHFDVTTEEGVLRRQAISMAINREQLTDKVLTASAPRPSTSPPR